MNVLPHVIAVGNICSKFEKHKKRNTVKTLMDLQFRICKVQRSIVEAVNQHKLQKLWKTLFEPMMLPYIFAKDCQQLSTEAILSSQAQTSAQCEQEATGHTGKIQEK